KDRPLWLGSLKSNMGHPGAAAGVGGVIKMMLAMQNGVLPKTLHAENPSPHVDWSSGAVRLLNDSVPWVRNGHPLRAAVSSFGISGTNAHVILEAPSQGAEPSAEPARPVPPAVPVLVSGRTGAALRAQAAQLREHLAAHPDLDIVDVAYSLVTTRSQLKHRAALVRPHR